MGEDGATSCEVIGVYGEEFHLLPERAIYWPRHKLLGVADLHWGKVATFHHHGIPIPKAVEESDLRRLTRVLTVTGAEHLVVLGDLVHHHQGLTKDLFDTVAQWRRQIPQEITLIKGNHDRWLHDIPRDWDMQVVDTELKIENFIFSHYPKPQKGCYVWAGHIHPAVMLRSHSDSLRLPCFHVGERVGVLPAFSEFTGGAPIEKAQGDRIFAVCEDRVVGLN